MRLTTKILVQLNGFYWHVQLLIISHDRIEKELDQREFGFQLFDKV